MLPNKQDPLFVLLVSSLFLQTTACISLPPESSPTSNPSDPSQSTQATTDTTETSAPSISSSGQAPRPEEISRYEDQVKTQMEAIRLLAGLGDYEQVYDPYINIINAGMVENIDIPLDASVSYSIIGVCDEDCTDLDFVLYDDNGNEISTDREVDDFPLVEVTPQWSATFNLQVDMYQCNNQPCYFGVGVFAENKPSKLVSQ